MNMELKAPLKARTTKVEIVDCDFHPKLGLEQLRPHLSERWWQYLQTYGVRQRHAYAKGYPFPKAAPERTYAIFLNERPPSDALKTATGAKDEEMRLGAREIYVHYPGGMGRSKLKIPAARLGTARNMNTVAKLANMALKS